MIWLDEGGSWRDVGLIPAPAPLSDVVEHFWIQTGMPKDVWRIVPDVSPHVIFSITHGGVVANCNIVGARSTFIDLKTAERNLTIGARLRPGALPQLVGDSAALFTDRSIPLEDIAGRSAMRLLEQMIEAAPYDAVHHLAQFLAERITLPAAPRAGLLDGITSVSKLAKVLRRSRRSAYSRLLMAVGLTPKLALRICRLHKALWELNSGSSLADAAAIAGYCDQAHFSRETVCLLGESPGMWRRRRNCSFLQDKKAPR